VIVPFPRTLYQNLITFQSYSNEESHEKLQLRCESKFSPSAETSEPKSIKFNTNLLHKFRWLKQKEKRVAAVNLHLSRSAESITRISSKGDAFVSVSTTRRRSFNSMWSDSVCLLSLGIRALARLIRELRAFTCLGQIVLASPSFLSSATEGFAASLSASHGRDRLRVLLLIVVDLERFPVVPRLPRGKDAYAPRHRSRVRLQRSIQLLAARRPASFVRAGNFADWNADIGLEWQLERGYAWHFPYFHRRTLSS